jgi:serine/threonine-protein kinase
MLGQTLGGKYKVVRLLGEGGMGAVYEGEQQLGTTRRKVAVKTLHPHLSRDPSIKARFEREVGTIAELEHPNTIQVYDFGSTGDGILYIVMEFLQGKSLADLLEKNGAMPHERVAHIMTQVCGSLEEAHGRGIVHRDLKPDNVVLVERAGQKDFVKLLDFGIAKRSKEEDKNEQKLTQQGMVLGTPPYMSPEQFTGRPIDARSDIYSLAVMAYEMLTGKLPFRADTAWEWATQHMTQPPIPIESLPEGLRAPEPMRGAIARGLAKAPEQRFQTVRELLDAFTASGGPAAWGPPPAGPGGHVKTEMGAALPAAFGPQMPPPGAAPNVAPVNAFAPGPANIPPPPAPSTGGARTGLLVAAGVIGVASVVAIGVALRPHGGGGGGLKLDVDSGNAATIGADAAPEAASSSDEADDSSVPALAEAGTSHPTIHPPPPPPPPHYNGPECQKARQLIAMGHAHEAQSWIDQCKAKGGSP